MLQGEVRGRAKYNPSPRGRKGIAPKEHIFRQLPLDKWESICGHVRPVWGIVRTPGTSFCKICIKIAEERAFA